MPKNTRKRNLAQDDDGLIEIDPETLALTVFNFRLHNHYGEVEPGAIAGIRIDQWTQENIKFKIDFTNPLEVSTGSKLDKL